MRTEIEELLLLLGKQFWMKPILTIARNLTTDFDTAIDDLITLDSSIPGLGLHNVNKQVSNGLWTGVYQIKDRSIFRGIQYVGMHLSTENPEWFTRMIVVESCYHVESCLKRKTGIQSPLSVGMILSKLGTNSPISSDLTKALWLLNRMVYNKAKHTIEHIHMDSHMFSIEDSISVYLICRVLGSKLLTGSGITSEDGRVLFP